MNAAATASSSKSGIQPPPPLTMTLAKSTNALGPQLTLSSSSSGQNLKSVVAAATSPIKDTIRGSQEFVRKLISSSHHSGIASSSSSEKVYSANSLSSGLVPHKTHDSRDQLVHQKSSMGLMETVKEKYKKSRSRRSSKDPPEARDYSDMEKYRMAGEAEEVDGKGASIVQKRKNVGHLKTDMKKLTIFRVDGVVNCR